MTDGAAETRPPRPRRDVRPDRTRGAPGAPGTPEALEDERLQVLKLVEEGRITPDQGVALLRALDAGAVAGPPAAAAPARVVPDSAGTAEVPGDYVVAADSAGAAPRWIRVRVVERGGRSKMDVQLPVSALRVGLMLGSRWVPQLRLLNADAVLAMLRLRAGSRVYRLEEGLGGDRVEISVE